MSNRYSNKWSYSNPGSCDLTNFEFHGHPIDADGNEFEAPEVGDMWPISTTGSNGPIDVEAEVKGVNITNSRAFVEFAKSVPELYSASKYAEVIVGSQSEPEPENDNIFVGDTPISNVYVGQLPASKMFVGETQIYPSGG